MIWVILVSREVQLTLDGHSDTVNSLSFSPSGQILISDSADKTIKTRNLGNGTLLLCKIASGSQDKTIKIWQFN